MKQNSNGIYEDFDNYCVVFRVIALRLSDCTIETQERETNTMENAIKIAKQFQDEGCKEVYIRHEVEYVYTLF